MKMTTSVAGVLEKIAVTPGIRECIAKDVQLGVHCGTTDMRKSVGHLKLTYAAQKIFAIARLPTHPERFADLGEESYKAWALAMESMTAAQWDVLVNDLQSLYERLQATLKVKYPGGYVPLQRRIRLIERDDLGNETALPEPHRLTYGKHLAILTLKAQAESRSHIAFDTDVLTGWCAREPGYYGEILVQRDVPIADVFMSQRYLAGSGLESDEWLILNREPTGILRVAPSDIVFRVRPELLSILTQKAENLSWDTLSAYRSNTFHDRLRLPLKSDAHWVMALDTRADEITKKPRTWWFGKAVRPQREQ